MDWNKFLKKLVDEQDKLGEMQAESIKRGDYYLAASQTGAMQAIGAVARALKEGLTL